MTARPGPLDAERRARLVLSVVGEPGDPRLLDLVAEIGPVAVLEALEQQSAGEISEALAERLRTARPEDTYAAALRKKVRFVTPADDEWPEQLEDLAHAEPLHQRGGVPLGLWVRGPLRLDEVVQGAVAVVGARSATSYGARVAGEVGAAVAASGAAVVSGAAFGIDQAAHRGALAVDGPTVAVLACGADRVYPQAHQQLLAVIADEGLVVSEAAPGCAPTRIRFLARNRLIAALSFGVVVVEAAVRSGALNTANWGDQLSRVVMGVPGPVTSAASQGVHQMIRARNALLVTDGGDVLEAVSQSGEQAVVPVAGLVSVRDLLTPLQRQVLDAVPVVRGATLPQIARTAGRHQSEVGDALRVLVAQELVDQGDGVPRLWRLRAGTAPRPSGSG
ncbi:DNA processing protein [Marmoricola sp. OAE513]|uniref:DNA-processing protein DprA n=1 Tax=Marmoricola sp. OAE513 TaxID=2817894 RepID=UPI001AE549C0